MPRSAAQRRRCADARGSEALWGFFSHVSACTPSAPVASSVAAALAPSPTRGSSTTETSAGSPPARTRAPRPTISYIPRLRPVQIHHGFEGRQLLHEDLAAPALNKWRYIQATLHFRGQQNAGNGQGAYATSTASGSATSRSPTAPTHMRRHAPRENEILAHAFCTRPEQCSFPWTMHRPSASAVGGTSSGARRQQASTTGFGITSVVVLQAGHDFSRATHTSTSISVDATLHFRGQQNAGNGQGAYATSTASGSAHEPFFDNPDAYATPCATQWRQLGPFREPGLSLHTTPRLQVQTRLLCAKCASSAPFLSASEPRIPSRSIRDPPHQMRALLRLGNPFLRDKRGRGFVYMHGRILCDALEDYWADSMTWYELLDLVEIKVGSTNDLARRGREYRACEEDYVLFSWSFFVAPRRMLLERLCHLSLMQLQAQATPSLCSCHTIHREYYNYRTAGGFSGVKAIGPSLTVESSFLHPIGESPCPMRATKSTAVDLHALDARPPCDYPRNVVFSTNQQWDLSTAKNEKPATKANGTSGLLAATKAYLPAVAWYFRVPGSAVHPPVSPCTPGSVLSDSEFSTCTYVGSGSSRAVDADAGRFPLYLSQSRS
ncbi:hypothetical protein B0H19DRAFT_1277589 [Mycena capillaripes]|nr:hypothetical protein B0H19DRAFT_1277589 [Mycena capillaripes]